MRRDVPAVDLLERAIVTADQGDLQRRGRLPEAERLILASSRDRISIGRACQGREARAVAPGDSATRGRSGRPKV